MALNTIKPFTQTESGQRVIDNNPKKVINDSY